VSEDDLRAELLALIVSGRPERLLDVALAALPSGPSPAARTELASLGETLSALALAEPEAAPSDKVRSRLVETLAARSAQTHRTGQRTGQRTAHGTAHGTTTTRAVLVIDMLNDHLTPGRPLEVPRARAIVPALQARLEEARRDGVPVVYICDEHEPDDEDLDAWSVHNVRGTEGAQVWAPLAPKPGDRVVTKPTYSAFSRSKLGDVLSELGVDTLVLTGCLTEIGIFATATDALQRGYAIEVPADAQAGGAVETEQATMMIMSILVPYGPARRELLASLA
jgi:nicotinamidase-related amidase